ncbi:MAG: transcriptional regulator GcvA [Proteobacteria bacterium]|nr:transcriptional regulator GcvA [Pseudomonadota bacterium]
MHIPILPLNALRAFEASARHLSLSRAAAELHVTPSALSHQIKSLEDILGRKLFTRKVRAIELTAAGKLLYPGLQTGFTHIREAVAGLQPQGDSRILVISTPPGFTAKWLAPRLYRFATMYPDIDARVSSSMANADFTSDGVDVAIRNLPANHVATKELAAEKLIEIALLPVCSPKLMATHGPLDAAALLGRLPLIHDETFADRLEIPGWCEWLDMEGIGNVDLGRGLRFNSADHALDAAVQGAGILLAHNVLAYDDLQTGRLVQPFGLTLPTGRAYHLVYPRGAGETAKLAAFRQWFRQEVVAMLDHLVTPTAGALAAGR